MARLDIRQEGRKKKTFKALVLNDWFKKIRPLRSQEQISDDQLKEYLKKKYEERYIAVGRFYNNITNSNLKMDIEQFLNYYLNSDYIFSGYGTVFQNHKISTMAVKALEFLLSERSKNKKLQGEADRGSREYEYYKIEQLTYKVLANSYYGILGLDVSTFFNAHIQNSITLTGQDIITTSISALEGYLNNNNPFKDFDDILTFSKNVLTDTPKENIFDWVDEPVSTSQIIEYFKGLALVELNDKNMNALFSPMTDEERTRIYYKNNLVAFLSNKKVTEKYGALLAVDGGYKNNPEFSKTVNDFTFYDYILEDRFKRSLKQTRKGIVVVDTDLGIGSAPWEHGVYGELENCWNIVKLI